MTEPTPQVIAHQLRTLHGEFFIGRMAGYVKPFTYIADRLEALEEENKEHATQFKELADFIIFNVEGEPKESGGAVDCAMRVIKTQEQQIKQLEDKLAWWKKQLSVSELNKQLTAANEQIKELETMKQQACAEGFRQAQWWDRDKKLLNTNKATLAAVEVNLECILNSVNPEVAKGYARGARTLIAKQKEAE